MLGRFGRLASGCFLGVACIGKYVQAQSCPPGTVFAGVEREQISEDHVVLHPICKRDRTQSPPPADSTFTQLPAISPGSLVTEDIYASALRERRRLARLQQRLQKKILELRKWRGDIQREQQEFALLRAEAAQGAVSDILGAIPADAVAAKLTRIPAYAKYLPADFESKFTAAFETAKALGFYAEGTSAPQDAERFKKLAEGQLAIRKALLAIPLAHENESVRRWLGALDKTYDIAVKVSAYAMESDPHSRALRISAAAEVLGEVGGVLYPPLGFSVNATKVAVRGAEAWTARAAMDELGTTLASNWNAEFYLRDKLQKTSSFMAELDRTISAYERR